MNTVSISVSTLCVPCENRCRYCLLSWDGKILGADYERSELYAEGFWAWLKENRPDVSFQFYYGYAMEHPHLTDAIDFARKIGSAGGEFLQLDGLKFREGEELKRWLQNIQTHGIHVIDLTFYGTREYHDRFAGRQGDFAYMLAILKQANELRIDVNISIPITNENADQMEALLDIFAGFQVKNLRIFVPHREGRGKHLESIRLTAPVLEKLSPRVLSHINTERYKSEGQWVREGTFTKLQSRMLGISLTPENIAFFENMPYADAISWLEELDDNFYRIMPTLETLAKRYGRSDGDKIFDQRDLYLYYQSQFRKECGLTLYDINDERQCFSRRF